MKLASSGLKVGMKLRIVRGDIKHVRGNERHDEIQWIAGSIPVGTVGTVYQERFGNGQLMFALRFEGVTPKHGYFFGINKLSDQYEVVNDE